MKIFRTVIMWLGALTMTFGAFTIAWALWVLVQHEAGWGPSRVGPETAAWARVALSLLLSGMFFVLVGAGAVLLSRYGVRSAHDPDNPPPRWTKPVIGLLFVSGIGSIALATLFAGMTEEFGDATAGIVSYCMLTGVGLLFSGWGLKRASTRDEKPPV